MYRAFALMAAVIICLLLMYLAVRSMPLRVRLGRNSRCSILLAVRGREPRLEESVMGLLSFLRSSRLYGEIIIQGSLLDGDTRETAKALAESYGCVTFYEDGEAYGPGKRTAGNIRNCRKHHI